jgi:hypothetical protein
MRGHDLRQVLDRMGDYLRNPSYDHTPEEFALLGETYIAISSPQTPREEALRSLSKGLIGENRYSVIYSTLELVWDAATRETRKKRLRRAP